MIPVVGETPRPPERNVRVRSVGEQVPTIAIYIIVLGHKRVTDIEGHDRVRVSGISSLVRTDGGGVPSPRRASVGIEDLSSDSGDSQAGCQGNKACE